MSTTPSLPPHAQLATMSRWYVVSRAIHTIAKFKIANYIGVTPAHVTEIASKTKTRKEYLLRILRFLSAYDIFCEISPECFVSTPLSEPLRDDHPHSIRAMMDMVDQDWWAAFGEFDSALTAAVAPYIKVHGVPFFEHLKTKPKQQLLYDIGMDRISAFDNKAIADAYDFSDIEHLVDLGGGKGGILLELMTRYPTLHTTLFDSTEVLTNHHSQLSQKYAARFQLVSGDFFKTLPKADAYLFKGVLHDFNDHNIKRILRNCQTQIPYSARILIAEQIIPEIPGPHPNKTMDIVMMTLLDGEQHTLAEWENIAETCGFFVNNVYDTESIFTLLELRLAR